MAENYVRPPLVATEPRSQRAATWRFRAVFALLIVGLVVGLVFLIRALTGGTSEGSPSVAPAPPVSTVTTGVAV